MCVCGDEAVGGVREEAHHDWAVCKEKKASNKSLKNAFTFIFCLFPLLSWLPVCAAKKKTRSWRLQKELYTQSTLRPWRIIKVPSILLSLSVSLCPLLLLPLRSLFLSCSTWSVRALWGCLITLMHTRRPQPCSSIASFSFRSRRQRLPRRALAHCKVMLKYFRRKCSPYSSAALSRLWLLHGIRKPIFFVFEKKDGGTLMRGLHKLFS